MRAMSFFWPRAAALNPGDDLSIRAGRLLHYLGVLLAVGWVVIALVWSQNGNEDASPIALGIATAFLMGGRALRYLLAAE
jgi:hypothetical protein